MTVPTTTPGLPAPSPIWRRASVLLSVLALAVVAIILASTTYRPADQPVPGEADAFDPAAFGAENYASTVVPAIEDSAVPLATLLPALRSDPEAAGEQYGRREGTGPFTYAISLTGTPGRPENGLLPVEVPGSGATRVSVQVGPAINGTALRDASGTIRFGDFTNQVEYSDAATALNQQMAKELLEGLDVPALAGQQVQVVGATTVLSPDVITVTPVSLEPAS